MLFGIAVLITASALSVPLPAGDKPRPLAKLLQDLDSATTRAHLTEDQRKQIDTNRAVLDSARLAKELGDTVDRRQVSGAIKSIHKVMDNGAFTPQDVQTLNADIAGLRRQ